MSPLLYSPRVRSTFRDIPVSPKGRIVNVASWGQSLYRTKACSMFHDIAGHPCTPRTHIVYVVYKVPEPVLCLRLLLSLRAVPGTVLWIQLYEPNHYTVPGPVVCVTLLLALAVSGSRLYMLFNEPYHHTVLGPVICFTMLMSLNAVSLL